jgi:hypothetical protein
MFCACEKEKAEIESMGRMDLPVESGENGEQEVESTTPRLCLCPSSSANRPAMALRLSSPNYR